MRVLRGINLSGGVVGSDADDNADLYGRGIAPRDVLQGDSIQAPSALQPFMKALRRGN